jgi:hypothetical protein
VNQEVDVDEIQVRTDLVSAFRQGCDLKPIAGPLRPPIAIVKTRRRRRELIPEAMRRAVIEFAQALQGNHAVSFAANARLRYRVGRLLTAELPPGRRRPGRPGLPAVTKAYKMFDELRLRHPSEPARILWRDIYRHAIEAYDDLNEPERRAAEQELRDRVRWRRRARKRALRRRIKI